MKRWSKFLGVPIVALTELAEAQGSSPRSIRPRDPVSVAITTSQAGHLSDTVGVTMSPAGSGKPRRFRHGPLGIRGGVWKLEFTDEGGNVTRSLVTEQEGIKEIVPAPEGSYVALIRERKGPRRFKGHLGWTIHYLDETGRELWTTELCCHASGDAYPVQVSEDGAVVAITDAGEGEYKCTHGYDDYPAPKGCVGLRVFSANGKELFQAVHGSRPEISPKGKYLLFKTAEGYRLLHVASGKVEELPTIKVPRSGYPAFPRERVPHLFPDESGVVSYSGADGEARLEYVAGKGMRERGVIGNGQGRRP